MSERFGGSQLSVVWTAPEFEAALHEAGTDKLTPLCQKVLPLSLNYAIVAFSQDTKAPCLKVR